MDKDIKGLVSYKKCINEFDLEGLIHELENKIKEGEYHRFVSKNDILENKCKDKVQLVEMRIMELHSNLDLKEA